MYCSWALFQKKKKKVKHCGWKQNYANWKHLKCVFSFHNSSLITYHLSLITYYLKYLNFPRHTCLALITQFFHNFLFKKKKTEKSCIAVGLCFKKKKKKSQTLRLNSERVVSLITKMSLKTKLCKLKAPKMCFQFP